MTLFISNHIPLVGYFGLPDDDKSDARIAAYLEDNLSCGWDQLTLNSDLMRDLLDHPKRVEGVRKLFASFGATCRCSHAAWNNKVGAGEEMSLPFDGDRERMLERCRRTLVYSALFGADTCVFHAEPDPNVEDRPHHTLAEWISYVDDALEKLLPFAEQCGVVIALENIWTELSCGDTLSGFCQRFPSPWLGLCFDAGHANVMSASGQRTCGWIPWCCSTGRIPWDDDILDKMLPHIVTTHLHGNHSETDKHDLPSHGNIDWKTVFAKLATAPRLRTHQHEVSISFGYSAKTILDDFAALHQ